MQKPWKETYLFIKLTKPVFDRLREKGYIITRVLDDTLICSISMENRLIMYHGNNANFEGTRPLHKDRKSLRQHYRFNGKDSDSNWKQGGLFAICVCKDDTQGSKSEE